MLTFCIQTDFFEKNFAKGKVCNLHKNTPEIFEIFITQK